MVLVKGHKYRFPLIKHFAPLRFRLKCRNERRVLIYCKYTIYQINCFYVKVYIILENCPFSVRVISRLSLSRHVGKGYFDVSFINKNILTATNRACIKVQIHTDLRPLDFAHTPGIQLKIRLTCLTCK
jgi:hypothetical protein